MPPQQLIDQALENSPQLTPEDVSGQLRTTNLAKAPRMQHGTVRPMKQIVDEFLAAIMGHPDCNVLSSSFGGRPEKGVEFTDTPVLNQHVAEIRLVWRDAKPDAQAKEQQKKVASAFEPGGKYYDLIPRRGEEEVGEQSERGTFAHDHLVKKREMAAV